MSNNSTVDRGAAIRQGLERNVELGYDVGAQVFASWPDGSEMEVFAGDHEPGVALAGARPQMPLLCATKPLLAVAAIEAAAAAGFPVDGALREVVPTLVPAVSTLRLDDVLRHRTGLQDDPCEEAILGNRDDMRSAVTYALLHGDTASGSRCSYTPWTYWTILDAVVDALAGCHIEEYCSDAWSAAQGASGLAIGVGKTRPPRLYRREASAAIVSEIVGLASAERPWLLGGHGSARGLAQFLRSLADTAAIDTASPAAAVLDVGGPMVDETHGHVVRWGRGVMFEAGREPGGLRAFGRQCSPTAFGHTGMQTVTAFFDPTAGISFAYVSNTRLSRPGHVLRVQRVLDAVYS